MESVFYEKRVRIPNRLRTSINSGSNDKGDWHGEEQWERQTKRAQ